MHGRPGRGGSATLRRLITQRLNPRGSCLNQSPERAGQALGPIPSLESNCWMRVLGCRFRPLPKTLSWPSKSLIEGCLGLKILTCAIHAILAREDRSFLPCDVLCVITLPFYPVQGYYFPCRVVQQRETQFAPNSNPSLQFRALCCIEMHPQVVNCHGRGRGFRDINFGRPLRLLTRQEF